MLLNDGLCELWGFEPQDNAFAKLQAQKGSLEHYFPHAVADGKKHMLHVGDVGVFASILPFYVPGFTTFGLYPRALRNMKRTEIDTVRLDDLADLPPCDLLKIDIQGGEKIVIRHGQAKLAEAVAVIPEVRFNQLYDGEPMFAGVDEELRGQGFILHKFMFVKSATTGHSMSKYLRPRFNKSHLIDGDAVYIRDLRDDSTVSDEQLAQLIFCADAIFQSYDLVCHCLDRLVKRGRISSDAVCRYVAMLPQKFWREGVSSDDIMGRGV